MEWESETVYCPQTLKNEDKCQVLLLLRYNAQLTHEVVVDNVLLTLELNPYNKRR
jgi:hypothetical protein